MSGLSKMSSLKKGVRFGTSLNMGERLLWGSSIRMYFFKFFIYVANIGDLHVGIQLCVMLETIYNNTIVT